MRVNIFSPSNLAFYAFIYAFGIAHLLVFHEMLQNIPKTSIRHIVTLLLLVVLLSYFIKNIKINLNIISLTMIMFVIYLFTYSVFHYSTYIVLDQEKSKLFFNTKLFHLFSYISYFLIGFYYRGYSQYYKIIYIIFGVLTINAMMHINIVSFSLDLTGYDWKLKGVYLFLGDSYAIISIITLILTKSKKVQFLLFLIALPILFILISRSSLYFFVFTMVLYIFIVSKKLFFVYFFIFIGIIFLFYINDPEAFIELIHSRMLGFLFGQSDPSVIARENLFEVGIQGIKNHWFEGDYGGEVVFAGNLGAYIHNYLGLLRQYGLGAFFLFCIMLLFVLKEIILWVKNHKIYVIDYHIFIGVAMFSILGIVLSRGIGFTYIFFVIGVVAGLQRDRSWIYK